MRVAVVIPALNEEDSIAEVVQGLTVHRDVSAVIVVDNGSTDQTARKATDAGALVVHEPRQGYGFACAAGSAAAAQFEADVLVFIDADGSSLPSELPRLLGPLETGTATLVQGSRVAGGIEDGAMPPHQLFGNWLSARVMNRLYDLQLTDLGPYRAVRSDLLASLAMTEMTFGWPTEMTVKAARSGAAIVEVPTSWHVRVAGKSKVGGTVKGSILAGYYILGVTLKHIRWRPTPNRGSA